MPQKNHFINVHCLPPFFDGLNKLLLSHIWFTIELGSRAAAKAQHIKRIQGAILTQGAQVLGPQTNPTSHSVNHDEGDFLLVGLIVRVFNGQCPQTMLRFWEENIPGVICFP